MSFLDAIFAAAKALKTTGADVDVSGSAPPNEGQILVALDATHAIWHDRETSGIDETARAEAEAAQTTANSASTAAAAAQSTANSAGSAAAAAQSTANSASTAAAAAQSTANSATTAAATAQTTANSAGTAAAAAQSTANSAQSTANAAVPKSLYDAQTILAATTDDTPAALTVGASTHVGRKASGNIVALTPSESKVILSLDNVTNDAQVKAAIGGYTAKSPVVSADLLFIGDSAASNAIKQATLADIIALAATKTGNPYIDPPASPDPFNDEFLQGTDPDLSNRGYTVKTSAGTVLTRPSGTAGDVKPWDATGPVGNTYWSTIYGSWIFIQGAAGVQIDISKTITLAAGDTYYMRTGGTYCFSTGLNGRYNEMGFYAVSGGALDGNNRVFYTVRDDTTASQYIIYDMNRVTAGATAGPGSRVQLGTLDIRAIHFSTSTNHNIIGVASNGGQIVQTLVTGAPSSATLTTFGCRNLFSASGSQGPQVWAIDFIRKKTSDAWIAG